MGRSPVEISICSTESESWDTIWKWTWFRRDTWWAPYRQELEHCMRDLFTLLRKHGVRALLDAACGLGAKTILLAEQGFEVEGADASSVAAKYAPRLAAEKGKTIRFFHADNAEIGRACSRTYDCVYSDGFDELPTRDILVASSRGIHAVLNPGGIFVFCIPPPGLSRSDLLSMIDDEWQKRVPFEVLPPCEVGGVRLTLLQIDEKTPEGILEKLVFLIEEKGVLRAEMAFMLNRRRWTFGDFEDVLKLAGFRDIKAEQTGTTLFMVAVK